MGPGPIFMAPFLQAPAQNESNSFRNEYFLTNQDIS